MRVILASASPRRKELLGLLEMPFEIIKSSVEEVITKTAVDEVVMELSMQKAEDVWRTVEAAGTAETLVIGADTVVAIDGQILGKPKDREDAFRMLKSLSGRTHQVYTGVALIYCKDGVIHKENFAEETKVTFAEMTDAEILRYIESGEPMDKAGSYGIQGLASKYISGIVGDYFNVVGLPVARLYKVISSFS